VPTDLRRRWNHNTHHHRLVLNEVGPGARTALDVGTGDGLLAADLRERVPEVTGIDRNAEVVKRARQSGADVHWVVADVMTAALPSNHFDIVASITAVHHLPDLADGLRKMAALTAPGGVLVVIGCARSAGPVDFVFDAIGFTQHQYYARTRGKWSHSAPIELHYPHTYAQVRRIAADALPGMRWRRLPLFRYAVTWRKPG
jgi:ubiquinone/menaquinone biosynthesis C-methylase UbiE